MSIKNNQFFVNQSNRADPFFVMGLLFFIGWFKNRTIDTFLKTGFIFCLLIPSKVLAQGCDYLPGDIVLNANQAANTFAYNTLYFVINIANDSILQVDSLPRFSNLKKGMYGAYAVTYKIRDSIYNLAQGQVLRDINSNCMDVSSPYIFSVCAPPQLSNLEMMGLEVCANGTKLELTDSIDFKDADEHLDTFSVIVSILESPDPANDFLDIDLSLFIDLQKIYIPPTLVINNIRSPAQVQAILRAVHFYANSTVKGKRIISFQVSDGLTISDTLQRKISAFPLPLQPVQIFRQKGKND